MLEVILDTETTGLSTTERHRIVEIGCIELENQIPTNKIFHEYINPERSISDDAYKIHGYTYEFLSNKQTFSEISEDFWPLLSEKRLMPHFHLSLQAGNNLILKRMKRRHNTKDAENLINNFLLEGIKFSLKFKK